MKIYRLLATMADTDHTIEHNRLSMTATLPIARQLLADGYTVTIYCTGEAKHRPPPPRPQPLSHPWKAAPSVVKYARRRA